MGFRPIMLICCLALLTACSARHYRRSADREVARLIAEKTPLVPNMDTNFTIEASEAVSLDDLPTCDASEEAFGADADMERGARILSLERALEVAVRNSRQYQNRKELLYLQALSLTLERHRYTPIFSGRVQPQYQKSRTEIRDGIDRVVESERVTVSGGAGVDVLMRTGTRLAVDFSNDFLRFLTGDPRVTTSSALVGTISQPLLRGGGYRIAVENLTQAERNLLYALREFTRFRKEFSVDVASAYFNVLQNRDSVRNSWRGFQSFRLNVARERAFAEQGLRSSASLDQIKQAELSTETRWINAVRTYRESVDRFKVLIGLPADTHLILDDQELARLEIVHPQVTVNEAVQVALVSRLDLDTQRDQLADASRKIMVAKNALLPQANAFAGASISKSGSHGVVLPDFETYRWNAGLDVELPFDRKAQRNSYRASLIAFERARRELDLAVDNVKLQISEGWRSLDQARRNYDISELGVQIAERRVEEQQLRQSLARGTARDLVDAQNDLIDSKNQRTSALVSHTIARLRFWRDMGILFITEDGQWKEISDADIKQTN